MSPEKTDKKNLRRVAIDPLTRVEGHGKVTLLLNDDNEIEQARLHIVEFRGFEKFIQGRPYWELPVLVQRLCGICPVSHHLAASKAIDQVCGVDELSPPALKLRKLLHWGQVLQSHALHFFHLASPDFLFGFDSDVARRNILGVIDSYPDTAVKGVKIRKYGQTIIETIAGKRIHGIAAIPGGMNKSLSSEEVAALGKDIDEIVNWCEEAVSLARQLFEKNAGYHKAFATIESKYMSLAGPRGEIELYHGGLRVHDEENNTLVDQFDYRDYGSLLKEQVKSWSYMKFPFLADTGPDDGWYRVGPLARINNCDFIPTPLAENRRKEFTGISSGHPVHYTLAYHWARMIEALYCAESIRDILADRDLLSDDLVRKGERREEGIGVIEAPRGTLFHHYKVDENDQVTFANLIVSTTNNNQAMNESIRQVASTYLSGKEITPELLNHIEVAVRAYDPCLSCATHAVGKMPLQVELLDQNGGLVHSLTKGTGGEFRKNG